MSETHSKRRLRKRDLAERRNCTTRTIDNHIQREILPQPHRDELDRPFWFEHEIDQHDEQLTGVAR